MGGAEQVVGALAVLEPEDAVAVLGPPAGRLVGLAGQQRGEQQLLRADRVHLVADDVLDPAQDPQARAAARCRCRGRCGGCSRRGPAAGGWAPRRPPGRRAACGRRGWTCGGRCSWRQAYGRPSRPCDGVSRAVCSSRRSTTPLTATLPTRARASPRSLGSSELSGTSEPPRCAIGAARRRVAQRPPAATAFDRSLTAASREDSGARP